MENLAPDLAFFGQAVPDTGVDEHGAVPLPPGLLPPASGIMPDG